MVWFMEGMCFLPVFLVIWSSSTFIISYIIALVRRDVDVILPYISDTAGVQCFTNSTTVCVELHTKPQTTAEMKLNAKSQETTVMAVHDVGALLFFLFGVTYAVIQSVISYRGHPYGCSKCICHFRAFFAGLAVLAVLPTIICAIPIGTSKLHWDTNDKDYSLHIASVACEWITTFSFVFFFLTYIREFQQFTLKLTVNLIEYS
ncbi:hypothetical protein cypCar_00007467 [Cyprinus carpio]|nr:hypothetical protein cypCar_00007467 [Cyprinus carpio]